MNRHISYSTRREESLSLKINKWYGSFGRNLANIFTEVLLMLVVYLSYVKDLRQSTSLCESFLPI